MGLDITAHRQLVKVPESDVKRDQYGAPDFNLYTTFYVNDDFPGRAEDISTEDVYTSTNCYHFRAGGYGFYNEWRDKLAQLAGYESIDRGYDKGAWAASSGPFWELITFSDCEGTIGSAVSKKLLVDFLSFNAQAQTHGDEYFYPLYKEFMQALQHAADAGALRFH